MDLNIMRGMGRKKKGYSAPTGLVKHPDSENWYIRWRNIYKTTGTPDLDKARLIFIEVQKLVLTEEVKAKEIAGRGSLFRKLVERYHKEVTSQKKRTRDDYTNSRHPLKFFGDRRVDSITTQDIYKYMDDRIKQKVENRKRKVDPEEERRTVSGATVNREVAFMSDVFKKAIRWGEITVNPCVGIEHFSEESRERYITDEELSNILKAARMNDRSEHLADIITALYYTGQRYGKIISLRWPQVDFHEGSITFGKPTSKNKKHPEKVCIHHDLLTVLHKLHEKRKVCKVVGPYVFQSHNGKPYRSIKTSWKRCCRDAGVEDATIHDIRHKSVTDMLNAGIPISKVKVAVGHSQTSTTDKYTHLPVEATREAIEGLHKIL